MVVDLVKDTLMLVDLQQIILDQHNKELLDIQPLLQIRVAVEVVPEHQHIAHLTHNKMVVMV